MKAQFSILGRFFFRSSEDIVGVVVVRFCFRLYIGWSFQDQNTAYLPMQYCHHSTPNFNKFPAKQLNIISSQAEMSSLLQPLRLMAFKKFPVHLLQHSACGHFHVRRFVFGYINSPRGGVYVYAGFYFFRQTALASMPDSQHSWPSPPLAAGHAKGGRSTAGHQCIGIDLGTTNSCIAYLQEGKPKVRFGVSIDWSTPMFCV